MTLDELSSGDDVKGTGECSAAIFLSCLVAVHRIASTVPCSWKFCIGRKVRTREVLSHETLNKLQRWEEGLQDCTANPCCTSKLQGARQHFSRKL